jgi:sec-independent protein translocase protein TatA
MNTLAFFSGGAPGPLEILAILFVILLLFGAKKLPDLARSLGKSLGEFKKGREEGEREAPTADEPESGEAKPPSTDKFLP